jgi:hypothetical protein
MDSTQNYFLHINSNITGTYLKKDHSYIFTYSRLYCREVLLALKEFWLQIIANLIKF